MKLIDMIEPNVRDSKGLEKRIFSFLFDNQEWEGEGSCHKLTRAKNSQVFIWRTETEDGKRVRLVCTRSLTKHGSVHTRIEVENGDMI